MPTKLKNVKKNILGAKIKGVTSIERQIRMNKASNELKLFLQKEKNIPSEAADKLAKEIVRSAVGGRLFNDALNSSLKKYIEKQKSSG